MTIFQYRDYKKYLNDECERRPNLKRGPRSRLAEATKCHTAYISQILNGPAHLSLEQGDMINRFFGHSEDEGNYFLLLIQFGRAGTQSLQATLQKQIEKFQEEQSKLENKLKFEKTISPLDQATYYSHWYYLAIHALCANPEGIQTSEIGEYLNLAGDIVGGAVEFLSTRGLIRLDKESDRWFINAEKTFHISKNSPLIYKHMGNWRLRALQNLENADKTSLHYSSVISVLEEDAIKIKMVLNDAVEKCREVRAQSQPSEVYAYNLDFFSLKSRK